MNIIKFIPYNNGDLYWKNNIYSGKGGLRIKAGSKAGGVSYFNKYKIQYKYVTYQGKMYKVHRLIFLMFNGYLTEYITYKDGNILNTRIENLIEANKSEINSKIKLFSNNKSHIKGVCFHKKTNKWVAQITKSGKHIHLGVFNTKEEAEKVYLEAKEKYFGNFLDKCKVVNG